tara:strand:- start:15017 stop:16063 length:1047 start_codon:yes stop_codon:yes gene_type:complete
MFHKLKLYLVTLLIISSCSDNSPKIKKVIVKDNSARLIDNPKTKSPITFVPIGTELEVINIKDMKKGLFNTTWFQVVYEDTVGWINMFFVTVDSNATIEDMKKIVNKNIPAENFEDSNEFLEDNEEINDLNESNAFEEDIANLNDDINDEIIGQKETDDLDKSLITKFKSSSQKLYTVQITSGKDLKAAESLVRLAESRGIDAYIQKGYVDNSGLLWYRVRSGKYQSIDDAQSASLKINKMMNTNSWVDNFINDELVKEELIPSISEPLESLPMFNVIDPWMKENIINYSSIKYIKWYDPYVRGTFHLQRVRFSILGSKEELLIDEREFKFWDGELYSVFDNQGRKLQ